jgi:hypothetical protein
MAIRVRVFSQHRLDWTDRVPLITGGLRSLAVNSVTLVAKVLFAMSGA